MRSRPRVPSRRCVQIEECFDDQNDHHWRLPPRHWSLSPPPPTRRIATAIATATTAIGRATIMPARWPIAAIAIPAMATVTAATAIPAIAMATAIRPTGTATVIRRTATVTATRATATAYGYRPTAYYGGYGYSGYGLRLPVRQSGGGRGHRRHCRRRDRQPGRGQRARHTIAMVTAIAAATIVRPEH